MTCPTEEPLRCEGACQVFEKMRPHVSSVLVSSHFLRDLPGFDVSLVLDSRHEHFTHLHKFEESVGGVHVFRALKDGVHIVYVIDKGNRLIFLRAFRSFKGYCKFLADKKGIASMVASV